MKKNKFIKYGSLFMVFVLMLCCLVSAADTITVHVSNPDNIPLDFSLFLINNQAGQLGDNIVAYDTVFATSSDGILDFEGVTFSNIPDGDYIVFLALQTFDADSNGAFLVPSDYSVSDQVSYDVAGAVEATAYCYVVPSVDNVELVVNEGASQPVISILMIPAPSKVEDSIVDVWSGILGFVVGSLGSSGGLFYSSDSGLTFLGTLAIIGLSFGLGLLIFYFVSKFLKMRG